MALARIDNQRARDTNGGLEQTVAFWHPPAQRLQGTAVPVQQNDKGKTNATVQKQYLFEHICISSSVKEKYV